MRYSLLFLLIITLNSCIQNYPSDYKNHIDNVCECMNYRKQLRRDNIPEEALYIYEDMDYKECIIDAVIAEIDTKGDEFTAAIEDLCPELIETQKRHLEDFEI